MDMNAIDITTIIAFVGLLFKTHQDKAKAAESLGVMKQQIKSLEARAAANDAKFEAIDDKLSELIQSNARLETQLGLLLGRRGGRLLDTPININQG